MAKLFYSNWDRISWNHPRRPGYSLVALLEGWAVDDGFVFEVEQIKEDGGHRITGPWCPGKDMTDKQHAMNEALRVAHTEGLFFELAGRS